MRLSQLQFLVVLARSLRSTFRAAQRIFGAAPGAFSVYF
jgi:hypothetical protein